MRNKSDYKNPQRVKGSPDFRRGVCRPPSGAVRHAFCAAASTRTLGAQTDGEGAILAQAGFLYIALNAASGIFFCIFINKDGDDMLDICLPGTGGTVPKLDRFLSCCYLRYNGIGLLIDCGEGTQLSVKKSGFSLAKINIILLTHFHADHCSGLPGLLLSMGNEGHTEPLIIAGPPGVGEIVKSLTRIAQELPFRIVTREMTDFDYFESFGYCITAFELKHSCQCLGYDIRIKRNGKFNVSKAKKNGVPMRYWNRLQKGECVEEFTPDMVLGEPRRGIHVTFATDTRPCDIISTMASDADLLICEGMFEHEKLARAKESFHMTMKEAAVLAKESGCSEVWLTHYSPALPDPSVCFNEALEVFDKAVLSSDGQIKTIYFENDD